MPLSPPPAFVHLHVHSEFSFLQGLPSIPELVGRAKDLGFTALALTDTDRMSGLILFHQACTQAGLRPILGATLTDPGSSGDAGETLTVLARNDTGYGDLCEIITERHLNPDFRLRKSFSRVQPNVNLLCCHPALLRHLAQGPNRDRLHGELLRGDSVERARSREVAAFCDAEALPAVASGGVHFLQPGDHELHRIVRAIALKSTLSRLRPGETACADAWLMSEAQIRDSFDDRPEAVAAAAKLAEDCRCQPPLGQWIMPVIEAPSPFTPDTYLAKLADEGLQQRYGGGPQEAEARELQAMELAVIAKLGYASYFLMVREVHQAAGRLFASAYRRPEECTLLRGSAANSITLYNLGASTLDPLKHRLYFQRFLNEDRAHPPDADLDFGWDEREHILKWMESRFGADRVAITCTTHRFRGLSAFREIAKVMGYSESQVTEVMKETQKRGFVFDVKLRQITAFAGRLHGKPHFLGQHPGGVLVTNQPMTRHVACERSGGPKDRLITQIDMHGGIDDLGLIKFDLLGNGSLSVYRDTLEQLHARGLPDPPVHDLEHCFQDPQVSTMMRSGRTRGIFYIESPAQIHLNQKCRAESFEEITVTSSLVRPAGTAYARTYVERHRQDKTGPRHWEFLHPSLIPILGETHDVCAFQEDVTRICHDVAGLSFKQADLVRKMMNSQHDGMPPSDAMRELEAAFKRGCRSPRQDGLIPLTASESDELWKRVASFTGFSFCKSHSASYAQLSFRCAWLKAHYPAAFLSSVISNNHGFYRREVYLDEARRWGLKILPLDINASGWKYRDENGDIRPGFLHLHHFSRDAFQRIAGERERLGPFHGLDDFLRRVPAGRQESENLILVGAFDRFGLSQPELMYQLYGMSRHRGNDGFLAPDLLQGLAMPTEAAGRLGRVNLLERCLREEDLLGYMLSADPVAVLAQHPMAHGAVMAADLHRHRGRRVRVVGRHVTERTHWIQKNNGVMFFLTLADTSGMIDAVFWPDAYERWREVLAQGPSFEIYGKVSEDWGAFSLEVERLRPVPFTPNLIDFDQASRRLQQGGVFSKAYADILPNPIRHVAAQAA